MTDITKNLNDITNDSFTRSKDALTFESLRTRYVTEHADTRGTDENDHVNRKDIRLNGEHVRRRGRWLFRAFRLRPNTQYKVYYEDTDVTQYCQKVGKKFGDVSEIVSDENGRLVFFYYFGADYTNIRTSWAKKRDLERREISKKRIRLVPADGTSVDSNVGVGDYTVSVDSNHEFQLVDFDYIQTFYVDPNAVGGAATINLTAIDLFFKSKSRSVDNRSGIRNPGVTVQIVDVENGVPVVTKSYAGSIIYKDYNEVFTSTDASIPTTFSFDDLVQLKSGRFYGIAISFDDIDYKLWYSREGDRLVGTNTPAPGPSSSHDGVLYQKTNFSEIVNYKESSNYFKEVTDTDLKFNVSVAKYTSNTVTVDIVNSEYEFLTIDTINGNFYGGEFVYQNTASESGNIVVSSTSKTVTGDGTLFDSSDLVEGDFIVITDGTAGNTDVVQVSTIASNTEISLVDFPTFSGNGTYSLAPIARVYDYDFVSNRLILDESNAKSNATFTRAFSANGLVKGIVSGASANVASVDDFSIDQFITDLSFNTPSLVTTNVVFNFAYSNGGTYYVNSALQSTADLYLPNHITSWDAIIMSRSTEVQNTANLYDNDKSGLIKVTFTYNGSNTNLFESPVIHASGVKILTSEWQINNDATGEELNGNAVSKHITSKLTFAEGRAAEDIRVYSTAFRPTNTQIKVYARIHNGEDPEAFDDKYWTELEIIENKNVFSETTDRNDLVEYTYGFPSYPPTANTLAGFATTQLSNNIVTGVGTTWETDLANNDIIKIYSPLFEENYVVAVVSSVDSNTQITLSQPISNNNVVGDGLKVDTLSTPYTAFNNITNDNVVRYHNSQGMIFDNYDSVSIKTVLLSDNSYVVPYVDDIRVVGVSA